MSFIGEQRTILHKTQQHLQESMFKTRRPTQLGSQPFDDPPEVVADSVQVHDVYRVRQVRILKSVFQRSPNLVVDLVRTFKRQIEVGRALGRPSGATAECPHLHIGWQVIAKDVLNDLQMVWAKCQSERSKRSWTF